MPSRRFHTKRRHGCEQCKSRRVKCDAGVPCQHCTRRQEQCSNGCSKPDEVSVDLASSSVVTHSPTPPLNLECLSTTETGVTLLGISHQELRLLDHYCTFVAPSISAHDHLRRMWQDAVAHQAKAHPFLMHTILSTSAHHLACAYAGSLKWQQEGSPDVSSSSDGSTPVSSSHTVQSHQAESWQTQQNQRYEHLALEQQHLAFQTYIPSLRDMTNQNQEALCAASALFSLNALVSMQNRHRPKNLSSHHSLSSPIDDWLEISVLVRGVDIVVKSADPSILNGVLQPLLHHRRIEPYEVESQAKRLISPQFLFALDGLIPVIDRCITNEADNDMYQNALGRLKAAFALVAVNPDHESIVMVWSNLLDPRFFLFVKRREPMALVLLAHWTIMFGFFEDRWWVGGLNVLILRHVAELLTQVDETNGEVKDDNQQDRGFKQSRDLLKPGTELGKGIEDKAKWRDLIAWPLRENGIYDL